MAKIGVITFSNSTDNYGQLLQFLAIQEFLKNRGHEVFLLRYQNKRKSLLRRLISALYHVFTILKHSPKVTTGDELIDLYTQWAKSSESNNIRHPRYFEEFRCSKFKIKNIVGFDDPQIAELDSYAIGSDQIWSYVSKWNFLGFVPDDKIKFSIAPSTGNKIFTPEQISEAAALLRSFSFVTCREESGIDFCKNAGYEGAIKLLDPTFLVDKTIYETFALKNEVSERPYIFVYLLGAICELDINDIEKFAQKHNLEVKYVASQGREDEHEKIWATIPEWLALLRDSKYVITNSFHGMALSIIYQKQFLVLPIIGITKFMNERLESLAASFSLQNRIYLKNLDQVLLPIDYTHANGVIASNIETLNRELLKISY